MSDYAERLKQFIKHKNLVTNSFAARVKASPPTVRNALSGKASTIVFIKQISDAFPTLNLNWLIAGRGPIQFDSPGGTEQEYFVKSEESEKIKDAPKSEQECLEQLSRATLEISYLKSTVETKEELIEVLKTSFEYIAGRQKSAT